MIESVLDSELMAMGIKYAQSIVSLLSYVVVDENDPAFSEPTKPIGPFLSGQKAARVSYPTIKTEKGHRRIVVSPKPVTIVEKREIKKLIDAGFIVICCGGGGIPVIREGRTFCGVNAVIDKDLASARLAKEVGVDIFLIATDEKGAAINFGTPKQKFLRSLTIEEAKTYLKEEQFPPGSMGPKVEAAIQFIEGGGKRAAITAINRIEAAVNGKSGTEICLGV
jgi:carbamate kinase